MAFTSNQATSVGIADRAASFIEDIQGRMTRYKTYRVTLAELSQLSARDLADLGIHRSMIKSTAYEAAYGK